MLYVRQTWKTQLIQAILCEGLYSFYLKGFCYSCAWLCSLYKGGTSFLWDLSVEISEDSFVCFRLALVHWLSYFFLHYQCLSSFLYMVFDTISSNITSLNQPICECIGHLNIHHKDWLTYSNRTDGPDKLCCNFFVSNVLTQVVNSPALLD